MSAALVTQFLLQYKYAIMAPAAFLLGPVVSLVAGLLLRAGELELLPTCLVLAGGELAADVFWYWLGRRYGERLVRGPGKYFGLTKKSVEQAKDLFRRNHDRIIFISKITGGFGFSTAIFFTAGLSNMPFARYMRLNGGGQIIWTAGLLAIGYFFGAWIGSVTNIFDALTIIGTFIILALAFWGFARYLKRRMGLGA
jgi:membrane protein DedA with SNARE-associated domain